MVTAQQVLTTCYQNFVYNGILPPSAAKINCRSCVVTKLRQLGIVPTAGETETDVLTGVRLSNADAQSLNAACGASIK